MIYAAKVLACAASELYADTSIIEAAKAEFKSRLAGDEYVCPIPEDAVPYII
jgi:aminobenzoyl-glutamate utilization protein B